MLKYIKMWGESKIRFGKGTDKYQSELMEALSNVAHSHPLSQLPEEAREIFRTQGKKIAEAKRRPIYDPNKLGSSG